MVSLPTNIKKLKEKALSDWDSAPAYLFNCVKKLVRELSWIIQKVISIHDWNHDMMSLSSFYCAMLNKVLSEKECPKP